MNYPKILLVTSAIFGLLGVIMGAHMAGAGSYALRPVHAHVLVLGWLTLFSWSIYYKVFQPKSRVLSKWHVWSAIIGTIGLTVGMWFYMINPFDMAEGFTLVFYILGGVMIVFSYILFLILAITQDTTTERQS